MTEPVEALKAAKYHAEKADATASKTDIGLSIAFALIALCERLDGVIDMDDGSFKVLSRDDPRET